MKKIIGVIVGLLVIGYFVNAYLDNKATQEAERVEKELAKEEAEAIIAQLVSKYDAVENWDEELSKNEEYRMDPILTIELEQVWIKSQPILFLGGVKDISSFDELSYEILIEQNIFLNSKYFFTELQLSLTASKNVIDTFLSNHPELLKDFGLNNNVALIAKINSIETKNILSDDGEIDEVKIGKGELIDIEYIGRVRL